MINEYLRLVYANLKNRRLRSFLTLVGIVIGVVAIILLYTTGQGMEDVAGSEFDKLGARKILVGPAGLSGAAVFGGGPQGARGLTIDDAEFIEGLSDVELVTYIYRGNVEVEKDKETFITIAGATKMDDIDKSFADSGLVAEEGRLFRDRDRGKVVTIGYVLAKEIFDKEIFAGEKILINNVAFKVVGVIAKVGNSNDDTNVWMPYDAGRDLFGLSRNITGIAVTVKTGVDLDLAAEKIQKALEKKRGADDFSVVNPVELQQQAKDILGVIKLVIVAIGLISLFVGGIGIMNSMYTAVLERTKEIGVMKAVGAQNKDIILLFLIEASIMGLLGGVIASLLSVGGIILLKGIFDAIAIVPIHISFSIPVFIIASLFAMLTGIVAGLWPAYKASRLKPVDALRYE